MGFWLMIFLTAVIVPYWLGGSIMDLLKEKKAKRKAAKEQKA
jgi:hypothetical protein|tara:strand:- start:852 stop:977 length:126 start_codon:yes stop_codon:yes gene_type:complete